jgi:hypothetical protein
MKADLDALLDNMRQRRLYGSIEVKIEAGKIVLLRKTETILPKKETSSFDYRENRGENNVRHASQR